MSDLKINLDLLNKFENELNPGFTKKNTIPTKVLGYGEISTVLEIGSGDDRALAYKRMPMFKTEQEAKDYEILYKEYIKILNDRIGLQIVAGDITTLVNEEKGRVVGYIAQRKLPSTTIGHKAIHYLSKENITRLILAALRETRKVFEFNTQNKGKLEFGIDGQISNWAIVGFDPELPDIDKKIELFYLDTSTPLMRKNGEEQLNPELFLRSAPSFLVWIIRLLFLEDVMTRYYDFRLVAIDLIVNFYKEQMADLIPDLIETVNGFFITEMKEGNFKPITVKEVKAYYREDAWIWRIYLAFRKVDRVLHKMLRKDYPYVLPGKIKRGNN